MPRATALAIWVGSLAVMSRLPPAIAGSAVESTGSAWMSTSSPARENKPSSRAKNGARNDSDVPVPSRIVRDCARTMAGIPNGSAAPNAASAPRRVTWGRTTSRAKKAMMHRNSSPGSCTGPERPPG